MFRAFLALFFCLPIAAEPLKESSGYQGIWYENTPTKDEYRYKYSGGTSDPTNQKPQLVHMVAYYDHMTGSFPRPRILLNKKTEDAHDNATLSIDDAGYLFIFCNAHGTPRP